MNLRDLRLNVAMSASDFAKELKVTPDAVYKWERGISSPKTKDYEMIAKLLRVDIIDIFNLFNKNNKEE